MSIYKGNACRIGVLLIAADGTPTAGLTPTVNIRVDGTAWKAATNAATDQGSGRYEILLDAGEMGADEIQVHWTDAAIVDVLQNIYPLDVALFKADVTNLDAAVSTRMPTTHISATAGTVDAVQLVATCTTNTDMRGTDDALLAASTPANFAALGISAGGAITDVTTCATNTDMRGTDSAALATELAKVPKKDVAQVWTNQDADTTTVTITQA